MSDGMRERMSDGKGPSGGDYVLEASRLTRYFGKKRAVYELDLRVPRGSVFALLGRNGSGKTTAIRMLLGLLDPTRGSSRVLGHNSRHLPVEVLGRVGYLAESRPLYGWMRVHECGTYQSRFHPCWKDDVFQAVVRHFRLDPKARAKDLSRGERAGLCLALTLAPDPELLILDDPTANLDPVVRRSFLEAMVHVTAKADRTIFFSSHLVSDVERVADHLAIMDQSALRAHCTLDTFRSRVRRFVLKYGGPPPRTPSIPGLLQSVRRGNEIQLTISGPGDASLAALATLGAQSVEELPVSLEDALISFLGARGEKTPLLGGAEGLGGEEVAA